jgi:streptogramin lyase
MQRTHIRALTALLLLLTVSALAPSALVSTAQAEDQAVAANPFTVYDLSGNPKNVYVEAASRIWFTLPDNDRIVLLNPAAQAEVAAAAVDAVSTYPTGPGTKPYDLVMLNGSVWFTALGTNQIGRLNPATKQVDLFNIPTGASEPTGITAGGGYIWFVERKGDNLGRVDPANGHIDEFTDKSSGDGNLVDMTGAALEDVAYSSSGPWFAGPTFKTSVALYRTSDGKFIGSPAGSGAAVMSVAVDVLDNVWIAASGFNRIGRSGLNTLGFWDWYDLPAPPAGSTNSGPVGLTIRQANGLRELWYTRPGINHVGRQLTRSDGTRLGIFENELPSGAATPWGIGTDASSNVWVAASTSSKTVEWKSPYFSAFYYLPLVKRVVQ